MQPTSVSVVVPCYNEEATLEESVTRLVSAFAARAEIVLEVLIVDDCSRDRSVEIATRMSETSPCIKLIQHDVNQGKGAALRTGFQHARNEFVGIHDADLEYDPEDLVRLLDPLIEDKADVVYGSRFLSGAARRVLYFWHSMGNRFLTLLSNMFTDLNLSDMETCYKVFRRNVLEQLEIEENRFGFEPEITAKVAGLRVRVFEMGISYYGRTYAEGKKIGVKDGFRALYCIIRYNGPRAPVGLQLAFYVCIGGTCALFNLLLFLALRAADVSIEAAAAIAFVTAAALNYVLCILTMFRHKAKWNTASELLLYVLVVAMAGIIDVSITRIMIGGGFAEIWAKASASLVGLVVNFAGRRWLVFPEPPRGPWTAQERE